MITGKKVVVVMPAYNAEKTLEKTFQFKYGLGVVLTSIRG